MINIICIYIYTIYMYLHTVQFCTMFTKKTILILGVLVVMAGSFWLGSIEKKISYQTRISDAKKIDFPQQVVVVGLLKMGLW